MPDPQAPASKVSQSAIDDLKKRGMSENLKMYSSGQGGSEFRTAMERYYSPQRLKAASGQASNMAAASTAKSDSGNITASAKPKSVPMPASAPAAATRKVAPTVGKPSTLGTATAGVRSGVDNVLSKVGGGTTNSIGGRNAGTETANAVKSAVGGAKGLYRMLTHTQKGAKPKSG